jgi:DNA polymerase-3 subunit beta
MKLSLEKGYFLKALSHGQSVVEKRTTSPILSHVLLSANSSGLLLTTTDMDMALIETIPAQVEQAGTVCVSAHLLYEIVRKLPETSQVVLNFQPENSQLLVTSNRSRFELSCLPAEDFPQLSQTELSNHFQLPAAVLKQLIDTTRFAMSTEETRFHLNGIHFHALTKEDGTLILRTVATDMHRLACIECGAPEQAAQIPEVIMGRKVIQEVRKLLDEADQPVSIGLSNTRVEFAVEGAYSRAVLSSRLVDGVFPDYQMVLDIHNSKRLIVPTKAFAEAIDRVGTIVNDKVRGIKLSMVSNTLTLSALSSEFGSAQDEMDVDFPYDTPVEICFNVRYLMDMVQQISTDEIQMSLEDGDSSVLVSPINEPQTKFVLMPMRI